MLHFPATRRVRIVLVAGVAVVLLLVAVALGLNQRPAPVPASAPSSTAASTSTAPVQPSAAAPSHVQLTDDGELAPVAASSDPVEFAVAVAEALFAWDTTSPVTLAEYKGRLLVVADPTGQESPGLVADLDAYLPGVSVWEHLRTYETRQWLTSTEAAVPAAWTAAVEGDPDVVAPGTQAVTITGTRHRAGVWEGASATSEDDVVFTVFVVCAPTYPTCHLLRLTQLDRPLR